MELIEGGMPLPAVQSFLGQPSLESTGELLDYDESDIKAITSHYLRKEAKLKTSARNVFPGVVQYRASEWFHGRSRIAQFQQS